MRLILLIVVVFGLYQCGSYVTERIKIAYERVEQCGQYDRHDRKTCLIVRRIE